MPYDTATMQLDAVAFNKGYAYTYIYVANDGFVTRKLAIEGEIISNDAPVLVINENRRNAWVLKMGLSDKY